MVTVPGVIEKKIPRIGRKFKDFPCISCITKKKFSLQNFNYKRFLKKFSLHNLHYQKFGRKFSLHKSFEKSFFLHNFPCITKKFFLITLQMLVNEKKLK